MLFLTRSASTALLLFLLSVQCNAWIRLPNSTLGPDNIPWKETGKAKVELSPYVEPGNFMKHSLMAKCTANNTASGSCGAVLSKHKKNMENVYAFHRQGSVEWGDQMLLNCWTLSKRQPEICFNYSTPTWSEDPFDEPFWRFLWYSMRPLRHLLVSYFEAEKDNDEAKCDHIRRKIFDCVVSMEKVDMESPWIYGSTDLHGAAFRSMMLSEFYWLFHQWMGYEELNALLRLQWRTVEFMMEEKNWQKDCNHGFNQAVAVFGAAINFPFLQDSATWEKVARDRLTIFLEMTIDEDGVLLENSPFYHNYMLILFSDLYAWADRYHITLPKQFEVQIPKMVDYAMDMSQPDPELKFPLVGASLSANYISKKDFDGIEHWRPRLAWLRSNGRRGDPQVDDAEAMHAAEYPVSGQLSFRSSWNPRDNVSYWFVDIGPWRNKHCDLDFFTFTWYRNEEILVDSGLGTYEKTNFHRYFQGSRAHNVMYVDKRPQPKYFDYTRNKIHKHKDWIAVSGNMTIEGNDEVIDIQSNYSMIEGNYSIGGNYSWARSFVFIGDDNFLVFDDIYGIDNLNHTFDALWHFPEDTVLTPFQSGYNVSNQDGTQIARLQSFSTHDLSNSVVKGQKDPIEGWMTRTYENYSPAPVLNQVVEEVASLRLVSFWTAKANSVANVSQGLDLSESEASGYTSDKVIVSLDLEGYGSPFEVTFEGVDCTATSHNFCRNWKSIVPDFVAPSSPKFVPAKDPTCSEGLVNGNFCCSKSCGSCGGRDCKERPGGLSSCCGGGIVGTGRTCDLYDAPCFGVQPLADPFCERGIPDGSHDFCCSAKCGDVCGGKGCGTRPGGSSECCPKGIALSNRTCDTHGPPCANPEELQDPGESA